MTLKVGRSEGWRRRLTLAAAAATFAVAIWTMHFVGMLALRLPFALDYLVLPTLLSFLVCVFVVGVAVYVASHAPVSRLAVAGGGGGDGRRHRDHALHRHAGAASQRADAA